ncbi:glycosylphosphatidylinositol anchor biosynthesis [Orbilia ellipsospora]|uniref:Mannosyltransferase n=1 Tax=Orbilia ellipsospora TaxID=2528407 RepID=A0AAV9WXY3_9PEZI
MTFFPKQSTLLVFFIVLAIRLENALTITTFFQPDEYFQSLELAAAWRNTGGYVTWEWMQAIRSTFYPRIFDSVYFIADTTAKKWNISPATNAELLVVAPKLIGAVTAAIGDVYTGLLAKKIWGPDAGQYALLFSICSAWNWFCSTRTFSNCLETTLTIVSMTYWPWKSYSTRDLTLASFFAALAFTVRPTNGLITWAIGPLLLKQLSSFSQRAFAVVHIAIVSAIVIFANALLDSKLYGRITLPFIEFYRLNVTQSIAEFYGVSPWHYYYSQGLPLLLTGYLPLALFSLYRGFSSPSFAARHLVLLANIVPIAFMTTRHKEVRFLYPLLPIFHVLMAGVGMPALPQRWSKVWVIVGMVALNLPIAYYTAYVHQRGVVDVANWLRKEHYALSVPPATLGEDWDILDAKYKARVGFLMPCHSTPWGSYMWEAIRRNHTTSGPQPNAWFLTCEPPLGIPIEDRRSYLDEADQFYANTTEFLMQWFGTPPVLAVGEKGYAQGGIDRNKRWPEKLVTFEATAALVEGYLRIGEPDCGYKECNRFFNSHFHDDWRRKGDVIVWCLR